MIGGSICVLCLWRVALRAIIAAGALMPIPKVVVLVLSLNRRPARRALRGERPKTTSDALAWNSRTRPPKLVIEHVREVNLGLNLGGVG